MDQTRDPKPVSGAELLTKKQFAELLKVEERTVDNWLRNGMIPGTRRHQLTCPRNHRQDEQK